MSSHQPLRKVPPGPGEFAATPDLQAAARGRLISGDPALFLNGFNTVSYAFEHRLATDPLFDRERLVATALAMAANPEDVYFDAGEVGIGQRWNEVPPTDMTVAQMLERIEFAGAWIVLRRVEKFPEYENLLDRCMAEIEALSGRHLAPLMKLKNAIVFINSPRRISSYHIDRECNWLLQIAGRKTVHIFDKHDRAVITEQELERFWAVDNNSAIYKPEYENRATIVSLEPGDGVHIPVGAPHWVQNGDEVSVSLSVNFHFKESIRADIYRVNYLLRRFGLSPTPPGRSPVTDWTKRVVGRPIIKTRDWYHRHLK